MFHWLNVCKKVDIGSDASGQAAKKHSQIERGQRREIESIFSLIPDSPAQPTRWCVAQCGQRHLVAKEQARSARKFFPFVNAIHCSFSVHRSYLFL